MGGARATGGSVEGVVGRSREGMPGQFTLTSRGSTRQCGLNG